MKETQTIHHITSKDGTEIGFTKIGEGKPILFVHGMTADRRSWNKILPYLEQHFSVHAMDRRGRGASGDSFDYDFMREAEDVAALVEAIGEPVVLFGHSFGGLCCLESTLLTDKISHLILYEPSVPAGSPSFSQNVFDQLQSKVDKGELESAMELFLREVAKIPEHELNAYSQTPLWNDRIPLASTIPRELSIEFTYRFDKQKFSNIHLPTMLLLGSDSPPNYRKEVELLDSVLPNSKIVVLPGQQHMAHHMDPGMLSNEVLRFLQE